MNNFYKVLLALFVLSSSFNVFAQNVNVSIDLQKQRFLNNVSNLNREKYFNMHDASEDSDFPTFFKDNNAGFGRRFWGPFADRSFTNPRGNFTTTPATSDGNIRPVRRFIATANPKSVWLPTDDPAAAASAAARYFVDVVDTYNRPEYWEPFNEPFIKASNFTDGSTTNGDVVQLMSEWFREMAKGIHNTPELSNMKVIGFSSAFPSFARRDFGETWQNHMKLFIDVAGMDIDAISVHPYDGVNQVGQSNGRSGSNSEAVLDLIETYTAQKFGQPKKLAITEFGVIESDAAFPAGPAPSYYNEARSAVSIGGLNNMLFNFFERQDNLEICIPFVTGRADFFYNSGFNSDGGNGTPRVYTPAIVRPTELYTTSPFKNDVYVLTYKANFYKFWKDVKGNRAKITSDDLDVQVQAFVDGNTVYMALNNLDNSNKTVNLNFISGASGVSNVNTSSLIINGQNNPVYNEGADSSSLPASVPLAVGETKLLKITYSSPIQFTSSIIRKKYYATSSQASTDKAPTVIITGNDAKTFTLSNVVKGSNGDATLRVSVGIPLQVAVGNPTPTNLDRLPSEVTFNGSSLTIPTNWKGYDQANRTDFYGTLEFNVPYSIINDGNNTVTVKYTKTGGRIAAVVLSLENEEGPCTKQTLYADEDNDGLGDPNTTIQSCGPVNGFVDNADDKCINDIENLCLSVTLPGTVEAENYIKNEGVTIDAGNTFIQSIDNGDATEYDVNPSIEGDYNIKINASSVNGGSVKILNNGVELTTIAITSTGDLNTFQDFEGTLTLASGRKNLRFEYIGTGANLFNINAITFISAEEIIRFADPDSDVIVRTISNNATSFTVKMNYSTDVAGQRPGVELRKPDQSFFKNNLKTEAVPISKTDVDFTITFNNNDLPLPVGDYPILSFIITSTASGNTYTGGDGKQRFIRVVEPAVSATDDESKSNQRGSIISLNILANDSKEDGNTPLPNEVTIDIDVNTNGQQTQLVVANEGTWDYDTNSGNLSFTPNTGFTDNPTDIQYSLTEISNNLSDTGTINFEYVQAPIANNDSSSNNALGEVSIDILNNDTSDSGATLTALNTTVDLDPSTPNVDNTLSAGVIGNWSYNANTGALTFTPSADFSGNPPPINYQVTENATGLSDTASVTITFIEFALAEFSVTNTGEVCANNNDGSIVINATNIGNFKVDVTGITTFTDNFTQDITISNLDAGDYIVTITDNDSGEVFVFNITISQPLDLSVTSKVSQSNKNVTLDLSGSEEYTIVLNGVEFTTNVESITLPLNDGVNNLSVKAKKDCQGKFDQKIVIGSLISAYPNPVKNSLTVETGTIDEVTINVFSISGKLLISKNTKSDNGISKVDMHDLAPGIYLVAVNTPNSTSTFKIIK